MVTPAPKGMTPKVDNDVYQSESASNSSFVLHDVNNTEISLPANITLNKLASMVTSEDNQNFQDKQEIENKKMREKLWWLFDGEDPERKRRLLLCSEEERKLLEDEAVRASWPHRSQNALMFEPKIEDSLTTYGVPLLTDSDVAPRKLQIVPKNTRIHSSLIELSSNSSTENDPSSSSSIPLSSEQQLIATPAPEPGVDVDPLMTWGSIDGTPLSLGSAVMTVDAPITPLPKINKREQIAEKLYKNMKKRRAASTPAPAKAGAMSPAALKLKQRMMGGGSGVDQLLKRSYTPGARTPSQSSGMTPGMTPGMKKRVSFVSTPSHARSDKKVVIKKSVTDDLL